MILSPSYLWCSLNSLHFAYVYVCARVRRTGVLDRFVFGFWQKEQTQVDNKIWVVLDLITICVLNDDVFVWLRGWTTRKEKVSDVHLNLSPIYTAEGSTVLRQDRSTDLPYCTGRQFDFQLFTYHCWSLLFAILIFTGEFKVREWVSRDMWSV